MCWITISYIDPGTTGMVVGSSLWGFIIALSCGFTGFLIKPTKKMIKRFIKSKK